MDYTFLLAAIIGAVLIIIFKSFSNSKPSSNSSASTQEVSPTSTLSSPSQNKTVSSLSPSSKGPSTAVQQDENEGCCGGNEGGSCACSGEGVEFDDSDVAVSSSCCKSSSPSSPKRSMKNSIKILYGTQTGTTLEYANKLASQARDHKFSKVDVVDLSSYELDDLCDEPLVVFVVSTYTDGKPPDACVPFFDLLDAHSLDWRVTKSTFSNVRYSIFGIGNSVYGDNFNVAAKNLDKIMHRLTAQRILPVGLGDNGAGEEVMDIFKPWSDQLWEAVQSLRNGDRASSLDSMERPAKTSDEADEDPEDPQGEPLVDMEDLGKMVKPAKKPLKKRNKRPAISKPPASKPPVAKIESNEEANEMDDEDDDEDEDDAPAFNPDGTVKEKEMLTPSLRKALEKQGYRLLGSHSGVKLCRWTKAMLRGRGGCYKHTFYGIKSYQCMEMTPSLACANKCVFCWRHHKNPVGTEWKWKIDKAAFLLDEAIKNHQSMIKQMKGVPGVSKERYDEAFTIRHCALSLVGEPITYPEINEFVDLLHSKEISSFMVTNAQFPDKIDELKPVTQLYISVDAATKDSLKKIDRPIFPDFWERFLACMDSLALKGQRTVYRLTLVKEWNMEEISNYAQLIARGKPSFVEVKGVTYCGTSKASTLTMQNVPFHQEVINFAAALCEAPELRDDYELAVEHEHSCGVLIAHKKFKIDDVWNTWIDYPKFHELVKSGREFSAIDYMEPTPYWALIGAKEKGFDPDETRFKRNKPYQNAGC